LSKVACTYAMDNLRFQKITITQMQYINVQQILFVTFDFRPTGAACGFMIYVLCGPRSQKGWTALPYRYQGVDTTP